MSGEKQQNLRSETDDLEKERAAACFLHMLPGIGGKTLLKLKQEFGHLWQVFQADSERMKLLVRSSKALQSLKEVYQKEDAAWTYYQQLKQQGIGVLIAEDENYPKSLKQIFDPPFLLYWKGDLSLASQPALAIVGCRDSTVYGRNQATHFSESLAQMGIVIVSGLARGIDTSAHEGALQAPNGKTIAVLGSGISVIYPSENKKIAEQIIQRGLLISEFTPTSHPDPGNFPRRNRVISGLSQGVLVIEARKKSGALITADFAMEQGREVYALPGSLTNACSEGPHHLIQQGAKLVMSVDDILEDYIGMIRQKLDEMASEANQPKNIQKESEDPGLTPEEKTILSVLTDEPKSFDEILMNVSMRPGDLAKWLLQMEIQGKILSLPGNCYKRKE